MTIIAWIIIAVIIYLIVSDLNKPHVNNSTTNKNSDTYLPPYNMRHSETESERLRKQISRKYDNKCCECGSQNNLQIHHLLEVRYGGQDNIDNLVLLCENCHQKKHRREFTYEGNTERKPVNNEKLNMLWDAKNNGKSVFIVYEKKDGSITKRRISPSDIHEWNNRLYVKAHCHLRNASRSFRVSRIKKIE